MLFLQCAECGFRTVPGTLELGGLCPRCVRRGGSGRLATGGESRAPSRSARRYLVWRKGRVEVPS